ncbi:MAG: site-specific DNA-methyltransferase, partial [Thermoplasmata archaeon]|nr:site-specific DNA-methyltransferase [Thermoplasmata archaeon]
RRKNKNELPRKLLVKMVQYSSGPGDLVCDLFMGGFSTARVAVGLGRRFVGFEVSPAIFDEGVRRMREVKAGDLLPTLRVPKVGGLENQGKRWTEDEMARLVKRYEVLRIEGGTKASSIDVMGDEFGRGRFSITNVLKRHGL